LAFAGLGEAFWRKYELTKQPEWVTQARANCDRSLQLDPNEAAPYLCLGIVNAGTGAFEKAVADYKLATDLEPTNDVAFKGLADVYQELGEPEKAESTFLKAIDLRPNYWASYNSLGSFYLRRGRYGEATQMFSKVIELVPDSFAGYSNLGACYFAQGDYLKAIPAFERSVQIRPTADATSNLGTAYFQVHQYAKAARIFEAASGLDAGSYEVWGNLGDAYYWAPGERSRSKEAYEKAISLALKQVEVNPRDENALAYLAQYYAMNGQTTSALNYIHRALETEKATPDLLATAALVFNQCADVKRALAYLQKAVAAGYSKDVLRDTPNFDNLRSLPKFQELMGS
jgi:serine/threonine-protein kinase